MGLTEVMSASSRSLHSRASSTSSTATADDVAAIADLLAAQKTQELALDPRALPQTEQEEALTLLETQRVLRDTRQQLERSEADVQRLELIRDQVEAEVRELTASLFQEAHAMVREANVKAAAAEKALKEARMQVEVLEAEVTALKTLVITSTPSQPNLHRHPTMASSSVVVPSATSAAAAASSSAAAAAAAAAASAASSGSRPSTPPKSSGGGLKMFSRHRRGASDADLKYAGGASEAAPPPPASSASSRASAPALAAGAATGEVDPVFYGEFLAWRQNPGLCRQSRFVGRLYDEDADRCLDFPNGELSAGVRRAVENNSVSIEEVHDDQLRWCALLNTQRTCCYRMKLDDDDDRWHHISSLCRNRITAVCDMFTYLRYIQLGLVKSAADDVYWQIIRLRQQMTLARLGLL